jgi:Pregnancy-associated plasma protein-A
MRRVYAAFFFGAIALPIGSACSTGVEVPGPGGLRVDDDVIAISGRDASAPGALAESDCSLDATTPGPRWAPQTVLPIAVVVHVIADDACATGNVSDELVAGQIAALNEDFRALAGTPGEAGADTRVEFFLATKDPQGAPSTGVTRSCNTTWHQDKGDYWLSLAWDPTRYLNLYTNNANGARGYVPFLPADPAGTVGEPSDRVVINWLAFGRPGPFPPYHLGRTVTHEVGHFLGLFHTYYEGCGVAEAPSCYTTGDRLCDTPPNADSHKGCPTDAVACGGVPAPVHNYMELTDDACLTGFTAEQAQRVRCTLGTYRPGLLLRELGGKVPLSR